MIREMICINCPMGCRLTVDDTDKNNIIVSGNTCARGKTYGINEVTSPKRMVTATVRVNGGAIPMVSVKTKEPIPKRLIFPCLEQLKGVTLEAPLKIGDVALADVAGSGVDVVVTKNIERV